MDIAILLTWMKILLRLIEAIVEAFDPPKEEKTE
jgi:hypothetical protein